MKPECGSYLNRIDTLRNRVHEALPMIMSPTPDHSVCLFVFGRNSFKRMP